MLQFVLKSGNINGFVESRHSGGSRSPDAVNDERIETPGFWFSPE
jgi:hypothetical protein